MKVKRVSILYCLALMISVFLIIFKDECNVSAKETGRIVIIGEPDCKKSNVYLSMIRMFKDDNSENLLYENDEECINVNIQGSKITLEVYTDIGQESFTSLITSYVRFADIILLVYNVDNNSKGLFYQKEIIKNCRNRGSKFITLGVIDSCASPKNNKCISKKLCEKLDIYDTMIILENSDDDIERVLNNIAKTINDM